jgi:tetratricopeptide (TPR) repeat protein
LKALELDGELAEAHASLGYILFYGERKRAEAETEFHRAIELNPSYSTAYHWSAMAYAAMGKTDEAIANINKAMELEPRSAIVHSAAGLVYYYARRYDEAISFCRKSLEINVGFVPAHKQMRVIYEAAGNFEEAQNAYQKERIFVGNTDEKEPGWLMITAQVQAVGGKRDEALANLKRVEESSYIKNNPKAYADEIAIAYALLGETEKSLEWLEKGKNAFSHSYNFASVEPRYDKIRTDARFIELTIISE